jgi:MFS family permease
VTVIGPGPTLAIDAASFAIASLGLFLIRRELKAPADRSPSRIVDDIREGIVYVARHPVLRTVILLFALASALLISIGAALTFRIVRDLGQGPAAFGLALTGFGAGTLVGSLFAARLGPGANVARAMVLTLLVMGGSLIGVAAIGSLPGLIAMVGLSGAGEAALAVVYVSVRAANSPDELVGRIASTARAVSLGLMPIGSVIGGILIDVIGGTGTLAILGAAVCALALGFSQVRPLRAASLAPAHLRPAEPFLPVSDGLERSLE